MAVDTCLAVVLRVSPFAAVLPSAVPGLLEDLWRALRHGGCLSGMGAEGVFAVGGVLVRGVGESAESIEGHGGTTLW
tara:strand:+ start:9942 stop:10172 length:231 start_codon:yes stop_codon:yes gene_type:complete